MHPCLRHWLTGNYPVYPYRVRPDTSFLSIRTIPLSQFFFLFTSGIIFLHSSLIFLVSLHSSSGSREIKLNNANLWNLNTSGVLSMLYVGTMILLVLFFSFTLMFDINNSWSVPQSVLGLVLGEGIQLLHLLLPITWSI